MTIRLTATTSSWIYRTRNPITRNNRQLGCGAVFCVSKVMIAPIRKQPVTFTITVPSGNRPVKRLMMAVPARYRASEPIAPPSMTIRYFSMGGEGQRPVVEVA